MEPGPIADENSAILDWFNLIPPLSPPLQLDDLRTGQRIWEVLQLLDPNFFSGDLPESQSDPSKWLAKWQNLKHISKQLDRYVTSVGFSIPQGLDAASIDLKSAANGEDTVGKGIIKLLKMVLLAALRSPNIADYVAPMQTGLNMGAQTALVSMITQLQHEAESGDALVQEESPSERLANNDAPEMDQALLYEQQLGKITARRDELLRDKQDLRKELHDLEYRHSRLQENNDILQQKLVEVEDRLKDGQDRVLEEPAIRRLENRVESQDDIIAGQEAQLSEYEDRVTGLEKEIQKLRRENSRLQPLQDDLDETRAQRDAFAKKANLAEKYQQKLLDYTELEKENQLLKGELEEAKFERGDGSHARTQIAALQRTLEEYRATLPSIERERHELQMMLKQMEKDNSSLAQELENVKDQLLKAQEQVSELRAARPPSPLEGIGSGLAGEMEDSERRAAFEALPAEERSEKLFRELEDSRTEFIVQKQMLEDQQQKYVDLEKRFEELHTAKVELERGNARIGNESGALASPLPSSEHGAEPSTDVKSGTDFAVLEEEVKRLKERLKTMEAHDPTAKKAADAALMKQDLKILRLENKLISTAWYDLNGRTHLNNVILQRKSEPPRGFLKTARELSDRAMAIRGR